MKQYLKWILSTVAVLIVFCCLPVSVHAQIPCDPAIDPTCTPIDGGLSFLIAAGVGYGIKKVRDNKKHQQADKF
jgi:hypothetical protein